MKFITSFT